MEAREGLRDVIAMLADVSDRYHRSNGRGVVCPHWQNALQHRQCSAMHFRVNPLHPVRRNIVDPTSERPGASGSVRSCPKKTSQRVSVAHVKGRVERDRRHMKNSLLSEIGGSRGARRSTEAVGNERLKILLDSSC